MSVFLHQPEDGPSSKVEFRTELHIGSDPALNQLVLPERCGVAPEHVVVTRAVIGKLPVLVDLAGFGVRVNRQRVITIRVLHHGDTVEIGNARLLLREMEIRKLGAGSQHANRKCPVCTIDLKVDEEVVSCPNCDLLHHRDCWFGIPICSTDGCQYPIHETVMKVLSPSCTFMSKLEKESKLVTAQQRCAAATTRDLVPFQQNQDVAFCPSCELPFHLECWLVLARCTGCRHDIKSVIDEVFYPWADDDLRAERA
jgi:hypothetical protein